MVDERGNFFKLVAYSNSYADFGKLTELANGTWIQVSNVQTEGNKLSCQKFSSVTAVTGFSPKKTVKCKETDLSLLGKGGFIATKELMLLELRPRRTSPCFLRCAACFSLAGQCDCATEEEIPDCVVQGSFSDGYGGAVKVYLNFAQLATVLGVSEDVLLEYCAADRSLSSINDKVATNSKNFQLLISVDTHNGETRCSLDFISVYPFSMFDSGPTDELNDEDNQVEAEEEIMFD